MPNQIVAFNNPWSYQAGMAGGQASPWNLPIYAASQPQGQVVASSQWYTPYTNPYAPQPASVPQAPPAQQYGAWPTYTGAPSYIGPTAYDAYAGLSEQQKQEWANYWQSFRLPFMQMAQDQSQWSGEMDQANQQFWANMGQTQYTDQAAIDLAQRTQQWNEFWAPTQQQNEITYRREALDKELKTQAETAAMTAWGRTQRPNVRYL
jgi:hypothetical protein